MLPISKHRTRVIPHRLALVAAGVCLVLSFTVDQASIDQNLQAERSQPSEQFDAVNAGSSAVSQPEQSNEARAGGSGGNVSLLPWFSGLMQ